MNLSLCVVFTADGYTGELIECNEGELCWIDKAMGIGTSCMGGDKVFR